MQFDCDSISIHSNAKVIRMNDDPCDWFDCYSNFYEKQKRKNIWKSNFRNQSEKTYNFCNEFPTKNPFGIIEWIKFRLKSKCNNFGTANSASFDNSRISLFANSSVCNDVKPLKIGIRVNLLLFSFKSIKLLKLRIFCSQFSSLNRFFDNSL